MNLLALMPFGNSGLESQRDSIIQPRVATKELPWVNAAAATRPTQTSPRNSYCATPKNKLGVPGFAVMDLADQPPSGGWSAHFQPDRIKVA